MGPFLRVGSVERPTANITFESGETTNHSDASSDCLGSFAGTIFGDCNTPNSDDGCNSFVFLNFDGHHG